LLGATEFAVPCDAASVEVGSTKELEQATVLS